MPLSIRLSLAALLIALIVVSCAKKNPTAPKDNGNGIPQGTARISGVVHDSSGAVIPNVALHIVYVFAGPADTPDAPQVPSSVTLFDTSQVLVTECGGTTPIPDSVMIEIFWDRNSNGPDSTDPQPPLCDNPPDCPNELPPFTVNMIEFPVNGVAVGLGAGHFYQERNFATAGDVLRPNRFYGRIYCSDGNVLYTSDVIDVPAGLSEREMHFHCTPCSGAPAAPAWRFDQPYPNPATDSVTVDFGLQQTSQALLTILWPDGTHMDSILSTRLSSGGKSVAFDLGARPNGLYAVQLNAGAYQAQASLLKNVSGSDTLRGMDPAVYSGNDGKFTFDAAAGQVIHKRGAHNDDQGTATLSKLKVVTIKSGYQIADTTIDLVNQQSYNVNLTLRTQ